MEVFCIHLPHRADRMVNIRKLERFYPSINIRIVEGVRHERGLTGCLLSHKKIVRMAKEQKRPYVWVIEDDCKFLPSNGLLASYAKSVVDYLAANPHIDIVNGCGNLYEYQIDSVVPFRDMFFLKSPKVMATHCIFYSASCYDKILALDENSCAIDEYTNLMNMSYTFPFLGFQVVSFSDIAKKDVNYDNMISSNNFVTHTLMKDGFLHQ